MTEPEESRSIPTTEQPEESPVVETVAEAPAPAEPPPPAPEPWTSERVTEWNRYYDIYVALGVLLLVFVASANKITHPSIWTQLRVGQVCAEQGAPLVRDLFSYTAEGKPWVNIPWLFEWSHYLVYKAVYGLAPKDAADLAASTSAARAEQFGAGALVAICALVRVATAFLLLGLRRPGPGLWWTALCVTVSLGAVFSPVGVVLGGIGSPGQVAPGTWGLLFLATEVLLLHHALNLGRSGALYALVPLFLLWVNVDESFLIGLLILAAAVIGLLDRPAEAGRTASGTGRAESDPEAAPPSSPPGFAKGLAILAVCAIACLANPSVYKVFGAALTPFMSAFLPKGDVRTIDQVSFFGQEIQAASDISTSLTAYYLIVTAIGLGSFVLNLRRFSLSRFLMYAVAAALWAFMIRYGSEFAIVFAATLSLNGQEWYQDRFGSRGRLGRGWAVWSVGGRAVSIVLLFLCIARALTGWGSFFGDLQFGFGFNPDNFEFEAADYLKVAPIKGNVLNTKRHQGDAIVWRAYPQRKTYIDNRHNLFDSKLLNEWIEIQGALKQDEIEKWKPLLDAHDVSAIMLDVRTSPITYQRLMQSLNWIPFYDDGNAIMFGRADAKPEDLAYFKSNRLDPETLAFRTVKPIPTAERPPMQMTWFDDIFSSRAFARTQPHALAAARWLQGMNFDPNTVVPPDISHCLMAIREARTALASKPDDPQAYRVLIEAYRYMMILESALLQGVKPTPENMSLMGRITQQPFVLMNRVRQRATALNFAIQTTPPPKTEAARQALVGLNLELYQLYLSVNYFDLARDRLQDALRLAEPSDITPPELREQFNGQLKQLDERVKQIEEQLASMLGDQQAGPIQQALFARANGAPGIAIQQLEEADRANLDPRIVKPHLMDLYCDTGQPDKAQILMSNGSPDDPSLGDEPGTAALRRGRVYFLLGNYDEAAAYWQRYAIPQVRFDRSMRSLLQAQMYVKGEVRPATTMLQAIPTKVNTQAQWEYELALCRLESGIPDVSPDHPDGAAEHFTKALTLAPDLVTRPIIAYYLEMIGKPVPPRPEESAKKNQAEAGGSSSKDEKPAPAGDAAKEKAATDESKKEKTAKDKPAGEK